MTTKRPSRKYVLIPMNKTNKNSLLYHTDVYTNIINNYLKTIKLEISVTVVLWTSSHILYGLPLYQKGNISKATY